MAVVAVVAVALVCLAVVVSVADDYNFIFRPGGEILNEVTIYHNPRCSKSRQTMAILEAKNITPKTVLYLETPPTVEKITELLSLLGMKARDLIRTSEAEYAEMKLNDEALSEGQLIEAMAKTPKLIQRPIVVANGQARIGRPPESVLEIL